MRRAPRACSRWRRPDSSSCTERNAPLLDRMTERSSPRARRSRPFSRLYMRRRWAAASDTHTGWRPARRGGRPCPATLPGRSFRCCRRAPACRWLHSSLFPVAGDGVTAELRGTPCKSPATELAVFG
eukprot:scaffold1233_cov395-Prasinococcus_capsulatus_cf.AAC.22